MEEKCLFKCCLFDHLEGLSRVLWNLSSLNEGFFGSMTYCRGLSVFLLLQDYCHNFQYESIIFNKRTPKRYKDQMIGNAICWSQCLQLPIKSKHFYLAFACCLLSLWLFYVFFVALQESSIVPGCWITNNNIRIINTKKKSPHILDFGLSVNPKETENS